MSEKREKFEIEGLSNEIVSEWYAEKGVEEEAAERENKEDVPEPHFGFSEESSVESKKVKEEEKKLLVKREIRQLLAIAENKGLQESIKEARKKNDPFLLDIYHDVLAKDAAYKNFLRR